LKEINADLWSLGANGICITTNLTVTQFGNNVMGGGCAREAADRYPSLPREYASYIKLGKTGVLVFRPELKGPSIIMFPVKYQVWEPASLELIEKSCQELQAKIDTWPSDFTIALPRPGCGLGGLDWETQVKPICEKYLDDRVTVVGYVGEK